MITKIAKSRYATYPIRQEFFIPCAQINPNANTPENPTKDD